MELFIWLGILFCISQSAMFSGLNLAFFSISRLRLEVEASRENRDAIKVRELRKDSNSLLTTILWGNVGINVLLTLLSNSVLTGVMAFLFSTVLITFLGEIIPQAYFSRHALKAASLLSPALRVYQIVLFPVSKPTVGVNATIIPIAIPRAVACGDPRRRISQFRNRRRRGRKVPCVCLDPDMVARLEHEEANDSEAGKDQVSPGGPPSQVILVF